MTFKTARSNVPHICVTSVPDSHMSFRSTTRRFWVACHSRANESLMTPNSRVSKVSHICTTSVPECQVWTECRSMAGHFRVTDRFENRWNDRPQMISNTTVSKVPVHVLEMCLGPQTLLHFTLRPAISSYREFWNSELNDHKMTLTNIWSNVPYMYVSVPDSQISVHFTLRPAVFQLQVIVRNRMTPWSWILQNHGYPTYNFSQFRSVISHFQDICKFSYCHWP